MVKNSAVKRPAVFSRIAFLALLFVSMTAATLHLGAFTAQAAQATMSWSAPTTNTDGTPLTNLGGYKVHIGSASKSYQEHVDVGKTVSYLASNLTDGSTYYFAVTAYDTAGVESAYSNEATKTLAALPVTHVITATTGSGGTITAVGNTKVSVATNSLSTLTSVTVSDGANQALAIAAATGYAISDVKVDGASVGRVASYTFSTVKADHTISATFAAIPAVSSYTITASAGTGGTITPAGAATLTSGAAKSYAIAPATGYSIAGVTVDGAPVGAVASHTFTNVTANHTIQASFKATTVTPPPTSSSTTFAVNSGGAQYTGPAGVTYLADTKYTGGNAGSTTATISGTTEGPLYQKERYGNFSYNVPVTNGTYAVTLKFAETYFSAAGRRVFSVSINGKTVISSLDLYARAGKNAAYDVVIPVSVTTGAISIKFTSQVNNAKVSAIKVAPASSTPIPGKVVFAANGGGAQYASSTGVTYLADSKYTGGTVATNTAAIGNTTEDVLYQSERYGNFSYNVPVANGNYQVTLKFTENYWTAAGKRVFSVNINGRAAISNLDIFAKAGKNVAYDVVIPVSVTNGSLGINFVSQINYAKVSAILVKTM